MGDLFLFAAILCFVAVVAVFVNKRLLVLLLSSVFVLLVAMRLSVPSMYLMGTVLLCLPAASWFVGWYGAQHLRFTLVAPDSAFEGEGFPVCVEVLSPLPALSVLAQPRCLLPDGMSVVDGSNKSVAIPSGVRQESVVVANRRGVYDLNLAAVLVNDPLGIFTIRRRFSQQRSLIVYPTALPLEPIASMGQQNAGQPSGGRVGQRGDDEGFFGTREYRLGDDLRRIHWRSSARHGSLVVAERETHLQSTVWICLDSLNGARSTTGGSEVWERCVKAAVSIMDTSFANGDAVGLLVPGKNETYIAPKSSEDQRWRILEALARLRADGETSLDSAVAQLDVPVHTTVALITPIPTPGLATSAARLVDAGALVTVVYVEPKKAHPASGEVVRALDSAAGAGAETMIVPGEA